MHVTQKEKEQLTT